MGYICARLIHKGKKKWEDVPEKLQDATRDAFEDLYGIDVVEYSNAEHDSYPNW